MTDLQRPDPDALLAEIQRESQAAQRGRLKIFVGMCAGAGKTYAMLQAAQQQKQAGIDVVIGLVETHGRTETEALLAGLEILPRKKVPHKSIVLEEMDIDALLARRPAVVLVDELAHTNAPGSRHLKRYQDVLELLDEGISVFTTVNIQHIESRVDVVQQITGISVKETVPDSAFDRADEVQLIDISPEQLRKRLAEGRVYMGERAATASNNFFREGNLIALREMALRYTAERVDRQVRDFMRERDIGGPWKSSERLLVGVGPSPYSASLVRWTRRIAAAQDASWIAVFIDTGLVLSEEEKNRVTKNLALARELGAEVETLSDPHVGIAMLRLAREHNVSQIIVGKPQEPLWRRLFHGGDLVDYLLRHAGDIDLYIVRPEKNSDQPGPARRLRPVLHAREFLTAAMILTAVTATGWVALPLAGYWSVSLFYLCAVIISAVFLGRGAVLFMAGLSALCWNFLFVPPIFTFNIQTFHDAMMFFTLLIVGLVSGHLTSRLRERERAGRERQLRTEALLQLTEYCTLEESLENGLRAALRQVDGLFGSTTVLHLRDKNRSLSRQPDPVSSWIPTEKEYGVALWTYDHRQATGKGTDTLPQAEGIFLPLQTRTSVMGVLGLRLPDSKLLTLPERELLEAFAAQIGLALEKEHFRDAFQRAELIQQSEKLRKTLLDNVSHELKTPVAIIRTALSNAKQQQASSAVNAMLGEIEEASIRLERVVALLVDSARIETGMVQPRPEWCEVGEILMLAQQNCGACLSGHSLNTDIAEDISYVRTDANLCAQAISHLLTNAAVHTPAGTAIELSAAIHNNSLVIRVMDRGPGLTDTVRIFEKFHRGSPGKTGGLGLGLSISRGLLHALKGDVEARNRDHGGAEFIIRIPVETRKDMKE
ncbi:MAG: sensor histidine kinase KdpD [Kiritimatiellaceae bacterium]|nr:sensor histidine kinase KdpD [Kiritimatiellaceae bacterium]